MPPNVFLPFRPNPETSAAILRAFVRLVRNPPADTGDPSDFDFAVSLLVGEELGWPTKMTAVYALRSPEFHAAIFALVDTYQEMLAALGPTGLVAAADNAEANSVTITSHLSAARLS